MTTDVIFGDITDGNISLFSTVSYANARTGTNKTAATAGSFGPVIGQALFTGPNTWSNSDAYFQFNTSVVGTDTVSAATLNLTASASGGGQAAAIGEVRVYDWGTSLTTADWVAPGSMGALTLVCHKAFSTWVSNTAYDFVNDALAANINGAGQTRLLVNSDQWRLGNVPGSNVDQSAGVYFADNTGTTKDPKLTVTHAAAAAGPANLKTIDGLAKASVKTVNGLALASVKTWDGLA